MRVGVGGTTRRRLELLAWPPPARLAAAGAADRKLYTRDSVGDGDGEPASKQTADSLIRMDTKPNKTKR